MHRNPLPYVDLVVSELLTKEIRFKSQVEKGILCGSINIMHRSPLSYVDSIINELLTKKIRFKSQVRKGILLTPSILVMPSISHVANQSKSISNLTR